MIIVMEKIEVTDEYFILQNMRLQTSDNDISLDVIVFGFRLQ